MREEMLLAKLEALSEDADFTAALANSDGIKEVQSLLASKGIDLDEKEVEAMMAGVTATSSEGELSEDDLSDVSGGAGMTGWDFAWNACKACYNFGYQIGTAIRGNRW